jgi:hypothetical protein
MAAKTLHEEIEDFVEVISLTLEIGNVMEDGDVHESTVLDELQETRPNQAARIGCFPIAFDFREQYRKNIVAWFLHTFEQAVESGSQIPNLPFVDDASDAAESIRRHFNLPFLDVCKKLADCL